MFVGGERENLLQWKTIHLQESTEGGKEGRGGGHEIFSLFPEEVTKKIGRRGGDVSKHTE